MCALRAHDAAQQQQHHHVVRAPDPVFPEPAHRCGICGKAFDRRDLRDRHKRRCVHKFSKPKRSKRKSCRACAVSKLGCDQGQPSCRRCLSRNLPCEYVGATTNTAPEVGADGGPRDPRGRVQGSQAGHFGSMAHSVSKDDGAISRRSVGLDENEAFRYVDDASRGETDSTTSSNQSISTIGAEGNLFGSMGLPVGLTGAEAAYSAAMGDAASASALPMAAVPGHAQVSTSWYSGVESGTHGGFSLFKPPAGDGDRSNRLPYDTFGISENMDWTGVPLHKSDMTFASPWNTLQGAGAHSSTPNSLGSSPVLPSIRPTGSVYHTNLGLSAQRDSSTYMNGHAPEAPGPGPSGTGDL